MGWSTVTTVAKKSVQRSVRFQADAHEFVDKLATQLYEAGVLPDPNFSTVLNMVIRFAMTNGVDVRALLDRLIPESGSDPAMKPRK